MKNILLVFFFLIMCSCVTQKKCSLRFPPTIASRDSIYIETIKEVKVPIKGDTIEIITTVNDCADQELAIIENGELKQTINILNGKLHSVLQIKPDTILVPITKIQERVVEVKVPEPVKFVPKFIKILSYLGASFSLLLIFWVILKIKKLIS